MAARVRVMLARRPEIPRGCFFDHSPGRIVTQHTPTYMNATMHERY